MNGIEHTDVYPSVLVQEMSPAKFSGVVNSANELSDNRDESTMSIDVGHGGGVDGMAAEFVYDRNKNLLVDEETDIPDNLAGTVVDDLSLKTFGQLDALALSAQRLFGTPQKIEFSFDSDGYWINQAKDLQAFRSEKPSTEQQAPAEHTMTVINHSGLYLKTARRLAAVAVEYLSSVKIVKLTGYGKQTPDVLQAADAKEIMELLDMNVRQGDSLQLIAQGPDAHDALNALSKLIYYRLGEQEHPDDLSADINSVYQVGQPQTPVFTPPEPEFFIVTVPNELGIHARPAGLLSNTATKMDANLVGQKIEVLENGEEIYGEEFELNDLLGILMNALAQGNRIRISAQGDNAVEAMQAMRAWFEDNPERSV